MSYFEFKNQAEAEKYEIYIDHIKILYDKYISKIEKELEGSYSSEKIYGAEEAFYTVLGLILAECSSSELVEYYKNLKTRKEPDLSACEIILDSIYDLAKYRTHDSQTADNEALLSLFSGYEQYCDSLLDFSDGIISAVMALYEYISLSFEDRRGILINNLIPVFSSNSFLLANLWEKKIKDAWLLYLIASFKTDLLTISKLSKSRFRGFFSAAEYNNLMNMQPQALQIHLGSLAASNQNLREAKNLFKTISETEYYLKSIKELEQTLNITEEMLKKATQIMSKNSKNNNMEVSDV